MEKSPGRSCQRGVIFSLMYEFIQIGEEPEPQASGDRFGPPRKYTAAGLLDPSHFPSIRPRCFGCSRPVAVAEIGLHVLNCDRVSIQDLVRFKTARAEFEANPSRAPQLVEQFVTRFRLNDGFQA